MMNAKEYLSRLYETDSRIKLKCEQVQRLHESLTSISAPMDKEQVSHSRNVESMSSTISRIVDMEREIDQQTEELYSLRREAMQYFDLLSSKSAAILTDRFINCKRIKDLMNKYHYCRRAVYLKIEGATKELQELFDKVA